MLKKKIGIGLVTALLLSLFASQVLAGTANFNLITILDSSEAVQVEVETMDVPEGTITIMKIEDIGAVPYEAAGILSSGTYFYDSLNQTCNNGAIFEFSATGPGDVAWQISWSTGSAGNIPYCNSSTQCHFLISTDFSAYYTEAWAHVYSPQTVWGPVNAYRCK